MDNKTVSNSKFYMLRCLIAMAHADGIVTDAEIAYISGIMNRIPLSAEQRSVLENDFETPQDIGNLLRHINDPVYRGQLPYFARILAFKDGHLHPAEKELLDKMHAYAVDGLDMDAIRKEARKAVDAEMLLHDISIQNNRPVKGHHIIPWFQWFDELLLKLGIDLLRD